MPLPLPDPGGPELLTHATPVSVLQLESNASPGKTSPSTSQPGHSSALDQSVDGSQSHSVSLELQFPRSPAGDSTQTMTPPPLVFGIAIDLGTAPMLGVALLLAMGVLDSADARFGFAGNMQVAPYAIVVLFMSLAYVCISLEATGLLAHVAYRVAAAAGRSGWRLFFATFALSSVLTVATSNDIVVLTLTPIVCHVTTLLQLDPVPYLIAQFFAANIWSAMLYIGNPTNIIVAEAAGVTFGEYSRWMTLPAIAAGLVSLAALAIVFRRRIPRHIDSAVLDAAVQARGRIHDVPGAIFGSIVLALCILLVALSFWLGIPVWAATLGAFVLTLSRDVIRDVLSSARATDATLQRDCNPEAAMPLDEGVTVADGAAGVRPRRDHSDPVPSGSHGPHTHLLLPAAEAGEGVGALPSRLPLDTPQSASDGPAGCTTITVPVPTSYLPTATANLSRVPWKVVPFVFSMFIMTNGLYRAQWFGEVAGALGDVAGHSVWAAAFVMGTASTLLCNVLNNQPMTILLTRLLQHPRLVADPCPAQAFRYTLVLGSNLGANLTFLGALAGIMWAKILSAKGVHEVTFRTFAYYGLLVVPWSLAAGCAVLALELAYWGGC